MDELDPYGSLIKIEKKYFFQVLLFDSCRITHTIFFNSYPNGLKRLESMLNGGEVFKTVLYNQVIVFMTHMTNYANDKIVRFSQTVPLNYLHLITHLNSRKIFYAIKSNCKVS
jgi:hypothetical protein